uniref:Capsid protein n=1 Tax=Barbastella barbastellus feces associated circovirus 1 TaxID=3139967 RepID=A0AAU6S518_9CIRC
MTVRARASSSRMGSLGSLARRTFNHFSSGRANRISLFNRNRGAGSQTRQSRRTGRDTGSTTRYADSAMLYRRRAAPKKLRNRVRRFAARVQSVIDGEVGLQIAVIPFSDATTGYLTPVTISSVTNTQNRVRRFAARVQSVIDGEVGLQIAVIPFSDATTGYLTPVTISSVTNTQATALIPGLYSMNGNHPSGTTNTNFYDIYEIFSAYKNTASLLNDTILEFTSACWNCLMTNTTGDGARAIVDIYECVARRDWKPNDDPTSLFTNTLPTNDQFGGVTAPKSLSYGNLGVTPFDNPVFCETWKILKVRRIKIEDGATATLQFRDPKHRKIEYENMVGNKSWVRGVTRCWIPIVYGAPNYLSDTAVRAAAVTLQVDITRNYHFRNLSTSTPSAAALQG